MVKIKGLEASVFRRAAIHHVDGNPRNNKLENLKLVYISGIAGFVGRHFAKRLAEDGHWVAGCDDFSSGLPRDQWLFPVSPHSDLYIAHADFRKELRAGVDVSQYDLIIHCAAVVGGRAKIDGDPIAVATDLAIDADFWNWIVKSTNKKQKVIYFSSSAVYPVELQRERMHCTLAESLVSMRGSRFGMPDQTYGWAKLTGEYLAQHAVRTYGVDAVIYRPFSGYGEDQSLDYPFPSLVKRVVDKHGAIDVWGTGEQVRDWIHIDDIVDGVLSTMNVLPPGAVMNLGSGLGTSFRDLINLACELTGHHAAIRPLTDKPVGVHRRQADTFFMRQHFTPKVSLEEGVLRMISHLQNAGESVA